MSVNRREYEQALRTLELDEEKRALLIRLELAQPASPPPRMRLVRLEVAEAEEQAFEDAAQVVREWWTAWKARKPRDARVTHAMMAGLVAKLRSKGRGPRRT